MTPSNSPDTPALDLAAVEQALDAMDRTWAAYHRAEDIDQAGGLFVPYSEAADHVHDNAVRWLRALLADRAALLQRLEDAAQSDLKNALGRIAAEAQRDAARKALESIAKNTCCESCQEASLVARAALAPEGP